MTINKFIFILLNLKLAIINSTTFKIDVLSNGKQNILLFYDAHTFIRPDFYKMPPFIEFNQAVEFINGIDQNFKTKKHLTIVECPFLGGQEKESKEWASLARENNKEINKLYRTKNLSTIIHLMCLSKNFPVINFDFRHILYADYDEIIEFLKEYLNKIKYILPENDFLLLNEFFTSINYVKFGYNKMNFAVSEPIIKLLDYTILDIIQRNMDKEYIFLIAGGGHCNNARKLLELKGFNLIKSIQTIDVTSLTNSDTSFIPINIKSFFNEFLQKNSLLLVSKL